MSDPAGSPLDSLLVWPLGEAGNGQQEPQSLTALRAGRAMVLDFWTSKCVKCPAALERLNEEAEEVDGTAVVYVSCALSQGEGNKALVADMVGDWEHLTHTFMDLENKEAAKKAFGFAAVPFYVVVSREGVVLGKGDPKAVDHVKLLAAADAGEAQSEQAASSPSSAPSAQAQAQAQAPSDVFSLDEDF